MGVTKDLAQEKIDRRRRIVKGVSPVSTSPPAPKGTPSGSDVPPTGPPTGDLDAMYKELCDKLAWGVGSTLGMKYGKRSTLMQWASKLASRIMDRYKTLPNAERGR